VYKLIGPTLIKQESGAAQGNVAKRLEYLNAEAYVKKSLFSFELIS
jgi:hypothetical protein